MQCLRNVIDHLIHFHIKKIKASPSSFVYILKSMQKNSKVTLSLLFFTVFIDLVGFGMIIPLIPYLGRSLGDSAFKAGALMAIYSIMQFIFNPIWGQLSDKYGRRPILLMSLLGASISHLGFAFSTTFWSLFIARLFAGTFAANISAAMAAVADLSTKEERSKRMGLIGAAFGLGFTIGPFFGGFVSSKGSLISETAPFGIWTAALVASLVCFINFVFALFFLPETNKHSQKTNPEQLGLEKSSERGAGLKTKFSNIVSYFKISKFRTPLMTYGLNSLSMALIEVSLFLYVKDKFNLSLIESSYGFAFVGLILVFTQGYLIRKLIPIFGDLKLIKVSLILFAISVSGLTLIDNIYLFIIPITVLSISQGLLTPSLTGSMSAQESSDHQGQLMGVTQSLSALGRIVGPLLAGVIYTSSTSTWPFLLSAILTLISFSLFVKAPSFNK